MALGPAELASVFGAATPTAAMEGVLTIFRRTGAVALHRLDFLGVPEGAALALASDDAGSPLAYRLCGASTAGAANSRCNPLPARQIGDRVRQLLTPDDVRALGDGGTGLDSLAAKVIVDMQAGDAVHFLSARQWSLHYTFIRERIYREPHLDRCDPTQAAQFDAAWREFSDREYFQTAGRRFLLATLVRYGGSGLQTLEFDRGDEITGEQMRRAFFAVAARTPRPSAWAVRAQGRQVAALKAIEGTLPVVEPNAPFRGLSCPAHHPGGGLRGAAVFAGGRSGPGAARPGRHRGHRRRAQRRAAGGRAVTEAFQTPLSHVGVLTRNRGTPNMALLGARQDGRLVPLYEGSSACRSTGEASPARSDQRRGPGLLGVAKAPRPEGGTPRSTRPCADFRICGNLDLAWLPAIGAKAAQLAELMRVQSTEAECPGPVPVPPVAFAIPVVHSLEHFERSGARALLERLAGAAEFASDGRLRATALGQVRAAILAHPVDPALLAQVEAGARAAFGQARFRLRSSSNTEDLADLQRRRALHLGERRPRAIPSGPVGRGLKAVWASLWADRAFDERELGNVDQSQVAMAVLVHQAYNDVERANGVAVSRDIGNPIYASIHYLNAQAGEASVTNPAPGVVSESMTYAWWKTPPATYLSRSSLTGRAGAAARGDRPPRAASCARCIPICSPAQSNAGEPLVRHGIRVEAGGTRARARHQAGASLLLRSRRDPADCREL